MSLELLAGAGVRGRARQRTDIPVAVTHAGYQAGKSEQKQQEQVSHARTPHFGFEEDPPILSAAVDYSD